MRFPGPAGIWVAHPTNEVVSNVVVASEGTGMWFSFVSYTCCVTGVGCWVDASHDDACRRAHGEDAYVVEARQAVHGPCDGNVAMSNVVHGRISCGHARTSCGHGRISCGHGRMSCGRARSSQWV